MPIDTVKTIMQVEGKKGIPTLMAKFKVSGPIRSSRNNYSNHCILRYLPPLKLHPAVLFKSAGANFTGGFQPNLVTPCRNQAPKVPMAVYYICFHYTPRRECQLRPPSMLAPRREMQTWPGPFARGGGRWGFCLLPSMAAFGPKNQED